MLKTVTDRKLLIVEDDTPVRRKIANYFQKKGNVVFEAENLEKAKQILSQTTFEGIILDLILPDGEGLDLFTIFDSLPPVIILSNLGEECDLLEAFEAGAVDYIVKPCSCELLETRLSLRLLPKQEKDVTAYGLFLDVKKRVASYKGTSLILTGSEFNILYFLMTHPGQYFSADQIYEHIWQAPSLKTTSIKYHISNLRQKLLKITNQPLIKTEFGKGYTFLSENI